MKQEIPILNKNRAHRLFLCALALCGCTYAMADLYGGI